MDISRAVSVGARVTVGASVAAAVGGKAAISGVGEDEGGGGVAVSAALKRAQPAAARERANNTRVLTRVHFVMFFSSGVRWHLYLKV